MAERNLDDMLARLRSIGNREEERQAEQSDTRRNRRTSPLFATDAEGEATRATDVRVEETQIYQLLADPTIENDDKIQAITDLLVFNYEDPENEAQFASLTEVRIIIAALIDDFTEQSSQSIRVTQDNPLSELTENIRSVFENYHRLVEGRADRP